MVPPGSAGSAGSTVIPPGSAGSAVVPAGPTVAVPSRSARSPEVVVATAPVPVVPPTWIPGLTWTPLREWAWLRLRTGRGSHTGESETGGDGGCCCGHAYLFGHLGGVPSTAVVKPPAIQPFSVCDIGRRI